MTAQLPHIEARLAEMFPPDTWLAGEAVAYSVEADGTVVNDWGKAQSVLTKLGPNAKAAQAITYMVFDLLAHGDLDARSLPFGQRRELLEAVFDGEAGGPVMLVPQMPATMASHEANMKVGFEGSVWKLLTAPYLSGQRGKGQSRLKPQYTADAIVTGFKPGSSGLKGSLLVVQPDADGNMVERAHASVATPSVWKSMMANPDKWLGTVVEVAHHGAMPSGKWRHPQFKCPRPDKSTTEVEYHDA